MMTLIAFTLIVSACGEAKEKQVIVNVGPPTVTTNKNGRLVAVNAFTIRQLGGTNTSLNANSAVTLLVFELTANEDIVIEGFDIEVFSNDTRKLLDVFVSSDSGPGTNGSFLDTQNRAVCDYSQPIFVKKGTKIRFRPTIFTNNNIMNGDLVAANLTRVRGFTASGSFPLAELSQPIFGPTILPI